MYVTRPRSLYKRDPEALSHPPEGPNLGYLVLQDEEAESYCCFGLWKKGVCDLPFPQNKNLTVTYTVYIGTSFVVLSDGVMFIPVLNEPLSSNLYYVIRRKGKHQGEASTGSKEEDMGTCFCCNYVKDVKSRPLNPSDEYQQFEILKTCCGFRAKSIASDGFAPLFLRRRGWSLCTKTPHHYHLSEALGINPILRAKFPPFTFSSSLDHSEPVVVGKWYCPFMFVKEEGMPVKEQKKESAFYEMTLERRWDKVFSKENDGNGIQVFVNVVVKSEVAGLGGGREAVWEEGKFGEEEDVMWFRSLERGERMVGLSMATVERMRWEQERSDWEGKNEKKKQVGFERTEKFEGIKSDEWEFFGFYVLVESFVLRRMDGSVILTYDFRHTNHVQCKWK
ncbi:uncharacterized protein LOC129321510 [Prosopis cineraria]|uniref:uncharacterized protein LOC129321510 n=1 Tax=Prosopis cineraria TaxID=364024 RepID=UPI00240F0433|nr:uncharacterized protein LOC129321510 [Prosopis cineraria]